MRGLTSLSQSVHGILNNLKGQSRILETETRIEESRVLTSRVVVVKKQEKQEMIKQKEEEAMNYLATAMEQDLENSEIFLKSTKETMDRINEEAKKKEEEKTTENIEETSQNNEIAKDGQNTDRNSEAVTIIDVTIPSTVVSSDLSTSAKDKGEQTLSVNVSA